VKSYLLLGLKVLVSCALIWTVYRHIDGARGFAQMAVASPLWLVAAVVLCAAFQCLNAWRWHVVLDVGGYHSNLGQLVAHTFTGFFVSQATPSTIGGDGVRARLTYRDGATASQAVRSVLIDRLFGLL
jgi:glycosyltransferase 2 family protein